MLDNPTMQSVLSKKKKQSKFVLDDSNHAIQQDKDTSFDGEIPSSRAFKILTPCNHRHNDKQKQNKANLPLTIQPCNTTKIKIHPLMMKYHRHEHSKYLHSAIMVKTINQNKKRSKFVLDDPTMQYDKDKDTSLWWWNTIVTSVKILTSVIIVKMKNENKKQSKFVLDDPTMQSSRAFKILHLQSSSKR